MCTAYVSCKNTKTGGKGGMKEGRKANVKLLQAVEKVVRRKVVNGLPWPPYCMGIYHQPKRPKKKVGE